MRRRYPGMESLTRVVSAPRTKATFQLAPMRHVVKRLSTSASGSSLPAKRSSGLSVRRRLPGASIP
jgi:hypothetical protein